MAGPAPLIFGRLSGHLNKMALMKTNTFLLTLFAVIAIAFTGCGKAGVKIDTAGIEKSFSSAETTLKDASSKATDAVKKGDYAGALKELQSLAGNVKLTDDQKSAINNLIEQVKKALADAGAKAAEGANRAVGDAQKAIGK
jgi:hypothetical protein